MEVVYTHCAGLDVHKKTVVACCLTPDPQGGWKKEIKSFGTMTCELLQLSELVASQRVYPRGDGIDRRVLEAGLQHSGSQL